MPDSTELIQGLINQAAANGGGEVQIPLGEHIVGPLHFPTPGIVLKGQGMMGIPDRYCSILVARDEPADGDKPLLSIDPRQMNGVQWVRGSCIDGVGFDVSRSGRFHGQNPPPVISLVSLSNCPIFRNSVIFGASGDGWKIYTNPEVPSAVNEGLIFDNCYYYGGYDYYGNPSGIPPLGYGISLLGANQIMWRAGKYVYLQSLASRLRSKYTGFLIGSETIKTQANVGSNISIDGTSVAGYNTHIKIQGADLAPFTYYPSNIAIHRMTLEDYVTGIDINTAPSPYQKFTWMSLGIHISENVIGTPEGDTPCQVKADNMTGAIGLDYLGSNTDMILGKGTRNIWARVGANPNGYVFKVNDSGQNNHLEYA